MKAAETGNALNWYCLRSRLKQERVAEQCLMRQVGIEAFAPRLRIRRKTRRGPVWYVEALFPGYLFAHFRAADHVRQVLSTMGVSGIVRFGDDLPVLADAVIEELRAAMGDDGVAVVEDTVKEGDRVTMAAGPMQGLSGLVRRYLPPSGRIRVLLEFMGRMTEIEVPESAVAPDAPRRFVGPLLSAPARAT